MSNPRLPARLLLRPAIVVALGLASAACGALPLTKGSADEDTTLTVTMTQAANLVPHAEVMLNDVRVGSVTDVQIRDWKAVITLGIEKGVEVPADVRIEVGQKSLLGAQYVKLTVPAGSTAPSLQSGATIAEKRATSAPTTEDILAATGALLGDGGLQNIGPITRELNAAFSGHERDWRRLLNQVDRLVTHANRQRGELVDLLEASAGLGKGLARDSRTIATALQALPGGLAVLEDERAELLRALNSLERLSRAAEPVLATNATARANMQSLARTLTGLAASADHLVGALGIVTLPVPLDSVKGAVRGDYLNLIANVDLSLPELDRQFLSGTPLAGLLTSLNGVLPPVTGLQALDPLLSPLSIDVAPGRNKPAQSAAPSTELFPGRPDQTTTAPHVNPLSGLIGTLLSGSDQ